MGGNNQSKRQLTLLKEYSYDEEFDRCKLCKMRNLYPAIIGMLTGISISLLIITTLCLYTKMGG